MLVLYIFNHIFIFSKEGFWGFGVLEAVRKDKGEEEIAKEVADILIRTLDLYAGMVEAGYTKISLDYAMEEKTNFNKTRPEKHGVRF